MQSHTRILLVVFFLCAPQLVSAQQPAYLREMPSVARVMKEVSGADPIETSARQSGAFEQFRKIIFDLTILERRNRNSLTPDEKRLTDIYANASVQTWQTVATALAQDRPRMFKLQGYATNPEFQVELLEKFFSKDFRALYEKANAGYAARHKEFVEQQKQNDARAAAAANGAGTNDPGTLAMRRCVASGRGMKECFAEVMGQNIGIIAPPLAAKKQLPGLRLSGIYTAIEFPSMSDKLPEGTVNFGCEKLYAEPYNYTVVNTGGSIVLKIATNPAIEYTLLPDGSWKGPGPVTLTGQLIVGWGPPYQQTVQDGYDIVSNRLDMTYDLSDPSSYSTKPKYAKMTKRDPILKPGSQRCNLAEMRLIGPSKPTSLREATGFQEVPPGLRMAGEYVSASGLGISFHPESATVACGEAELSDKYTITATGKEILIRLANGNSPFSMVVRADGTLVPAGQGTITINGRVMTGMNGTQPVFAPLPPARCQLVSLSPRQ
jgi:hypothetical protein